VPVGVPEAPSSFDRTMMGRSRYQRFALLAGLTPRDRPHPIAPPRSHENRPGAALADVDGGIILKLVEAIVGESGQWLDVRRQ
jgi:hypothetical protein